MASKVAPLRRARDPSTSLRSAQDDKVGLATRQIVRREHQALDPPAACERFHDLRHIGWSDTPIKKMVRLDQNADTARTLVEAARFADARAEFRQSPRCHPLLQRCPDFLGPARGARTFRVVIRPPVRADKKVALALRHVVKSTAAARRSTRFAENYLLSCGTVVLRDSGLSCGTLVHEVNKRLPATRTSAKMTSFFIRAWLSRRAWPRPGKTASH